MVRLDQLLVDRGLCQSLGRASALIMAGQVLIDEQVVDKSGTPVARDCNVRLKEQLPYVSRGGLKLEGGLTHFDINPGGWVCLDIGAATGGFTDCLLQHGAVKVYAVDVAYGMLDWKIRSDPRVIVLERCNARHLDGNHVPEAIDFCVFDTSFISLTKVLPPVLTLFGSKPIRLLCLVKPQFELHRSQIGPGGLVTDETLQIEAVQTIIDFGESLQLTSRGYVKSNIKGSKGNQEYLIFLEGEQQTTSC